MTTLGPRAWMEGTCWVIHATSSDLALLLATAQSFGGLVPSAHTVLRPDCVVIAVPDVDDGEADSGRRRELGEQALLATSLLLSSPGVVWIGVARGYCKEHSTPMLQPGLLGRGVVRAERAWRAARVRSGTGSSVAFGDDDPGDFAAFRRFVLGRDKEVQEDLDALFPPREEDVPTSGQRLRSRIVEVSTILGTAYGRPLVEWSPEPAPAAGPTPAHPAAPLIERTETVVPGSSAVGGAPPSPEKVPIAFSVIVELITVSDAPAALSLSDETCRFEWVARKHLPALLDLEPTHPDPSAAVGPVWSLDNQLYFCSIGRGFQLCRYFEGEPDAEQRRLLLSWLVTFVTELRHRRLDARIAVSLGVQRTVATSSPSRPDPWMARIPVVRPNCAMQAHEKSSTILEHLRGEEWRDRAVLVIAADDEGHRCRGLLDAVAGSKAEYVRGDAASGTLLPAARGDDGFVLRKLELDDVERTFGVTLDAAVQFAPPEAPKRRLNRWLARCAGEPTSRSSANVRESANAAATPPTPWSFATLCARQRADRVFEACAPKAATVALHDIRTHNFARAMLEAALTSAAGVLVLATHDGRGPAFAAIVVLIAVALGAFHAWFWGCLIGRLMWTHVGPTMRRFCFKRDARDAIQRLKIRLLLPMDAPAPADTLFGGWRRFAPQPAEGKVRADGRPRPAADRPELRMSPGIFWTLGIPGAVSYGFFAAALVFVLVSGFDARLPAGWAGWAWWTIGAGGAAGVLWNAALVLRLRSLSFEHFSTYKHVELAGRIKVFAFLEVAVAGISCAVHGIAFGWIAFESPHGWAKGCGWAGMFFSLGVLVFIGISRSFTARGATEKIDAQIIDRPLLGRARTSAARRRSLKRALDAVWNQRREPTVQRALIEAEAVFVVDQYGDVIWQRGLADDELAAHEMFADGKFAAKIVGDLVRYARRRWLRLSVVLDAGALAGGKRADEIRTVAASLDALGLGVGDELPTGYLAVVRTVGPVAKPAARLDARRRKPAGASALRADR